MADEFAGHQPTLIAPGERHYVVAPSENALDPKPRTLFVGVGGTLTIVDQANVSVTYTVPDGFIMPFRGVKVTAATAQNIVAWY